MTKPVIAHSLEDGSIQLLKEHLEGVSELSGKFASKFGYEEFGKALGLLHDIGKYSNSFQHRIWDKGPKVDHSTAGSQLARDYYSQTVGQVWTDVLLGEAIAGHHTGLCNMGTQVDTSDLGTYCARMKKHVDCYDRYSSEIKLPDLKSPVPPEMKSEEEAGFYFQFLTRMLFSCLVDADFLDTERFMKKGQVNRSEGRSIEELRFEFLKSVQQKGWLEVPDSSLNGRRREILQSCLRQGKTSRQGMFSLTVPTGGGKTMASLGFALEHAAHNHMDRIIYVTPYTTIIEQNAQTIKEALGSDSVLEHHSSFDFSKSEELQNLELSAENWNIPIVVTSNVQFFESFFGSRSSVCRKLHNVANSVIIFDEVQSIPIEYFIPCMEVVKQLSDHYGTSVVFSTATQPSLGLFLNGTAVQELCPNVFDQFDCFKRQNFVNIGKLDSMALCSMLNSEYQALCVLNTRKLTQSVFKGLKEKEGIFCLTTFQTPEDRKKKIAEIRKRLDLGLRCVVVSTSLIEAGVDLDFQNVYRQQAGLDSILQAAGRGNRECRRPSQECKVYIFQIPEEANPKSISNAESVFDSMTKKGIAVDDPSAVRIYFDELFSIKGERLDEKQILKLFPLLSPSFREGERKMKMIQENEFKIVVCNSESRGLISAIRDGKADKTTIRQLQQYSVNVPSYLFEHLRKNGAVEELSSFNDLFVLRDSSNYSAETGLGSRW